jgi:hypothetical protein
MKSFRDAKLAYHKEQRASKKTPIQNLFKSTYKSGNISKREKVTSCLSLTYSVCLRMDLYTQK